MDYYIFEITEDPKNLYQLTANRLKNKCLNNSTRFKQADIEQQRILISLLEPAINIDVDDNFDYYFEINYDKLKNYFKSRFDFAKTIMSNSGIEQFIDHKRAQKLANLICHEYDHYICYDHKFIKLDEFIRTCELGKTYYIGSVVQIL